MAEQGRKGLPQFAPALLRYLGGEAMSVDGVASVPASATYVRIAAEGGDVYYAFNAGDVTASSPGFCSQDGERLAGPLGNIESLRIHLGAGAVAHIEYYN